MFREMLDLLWPRVCPVCEGECVDAEAVHAGCLSRIRRVTPLARDTVVACFEDGPDWFRLLHRWKYGGERKLAGAVADAMVESGDRLPSGSVLVPLPDDPLRRSARGFSPVGDLSARLGARRKLPLDATLLRRARPAGSQTTCADDAGRRANVRGIFRVGDLSRWPAGRPLVLVEDQVTSGATVAEAARLLALRGAPVWVWCAARALRAPRRLDGAGGRH